MFGIDVHVFVHVDAVARVFKWPRAITTRACTGFFIKQLLGTTEAMPVEMLDQYHRLPQNLYVGWNGELDEGARPTLDESQGHEIYYDLFI